MVERILWLGWVALIFAVLGFGGAIPSSFYQNLFQTSLVLALVKPLYVFSLMLASSIFILCAVQRRSRIASLLSTIGQNATWLAASLVAASPFLYLVITKRLVVDFWLDELISIRRHIVTTIDRALLWYPLPNNHVFTNALSGIYLKLLDAKNLLTVLENPQVLRLFYLLFALGAVLVAGGTAYRFISKSASLITVVLWTTTIVFLNYAAQVHGYAPTLFFVSLLLFFILKYREEQSLSTGLVILTLAAMLFYTMPSNIYFLGGLAAYFAVDGIIAMRKTGQWRFSIRDSAFTLGNRELSICIFIGLGCLLAFVFYLPILKKMLDNRYLATLGWFQGTAFSHTFGPVITAFVSDRWHLFLLAAAGFVIGTIALDPQLKKYRSMVFFLAFSILLPFILSFIRGDDPFVRTFLFSMPAFFLLGAIGLEIIFVMVRERVRSSKFQIPALILAFIVYANIVFVMSYNRISEQIRYVLETEDVNFVEYRDDRLAASVFLDHYSVLDVVREFLALADPAVPVYVDQANTRYDFALTSYMEAFNIDYVSTGDFGSLSGSQVYIFLSYPRKSMNELKSFFPEAHCELITETLSIYRVAECTLD